MAVLEILQYPNKNLRIKATPVENIDEVKAVVDDMYETMYHSQGVGLAATQVDIHLRFFTMDVSESKDQAICVINPEIIHSEGEQFEGEGCLSVQGGYDKVMRAKKVIMRVQDLDGKTFEMEAEDLMAVCIQHEIDHLNGVLFIDHLSRLKKQRIADKIKKLTKLSSKADKE